MAKEVVSVDGKLYLYEETTGEIFEVHLDKKVAPTSAIVKAVVEQHAALLLSRK